MDQVCSIKPANQAIIVIVCEMFTTEFLTNEI